MNWKRKITKLAINNPKKVVVFFLVITILLALQIPKIKIDTDPENMLSEDTFVRQFHDQVKKDFELHDMIVLGVVNEQNENGVFNPQTLDHIYQLTNKIKTIDGVVSGDIIAPSTQDNIKQGGVGRVRFEWLMKEPPETESEALKIRDQALDNPLLKGTMVSKDGEAVAIYVPLESKDLSYEVSHKIKTELNKFAGQANYYISGLPVAEDTFGVQMFKQMAISAPLAMLVIFLLLWFFFRKLSIITSPMIIALMSVVITMGTLIGLGYKVHIMSSMIPIFLMPIAVVDSVHILSEFYDTYQQTKDKEETILEVMDELFVPMLYTSLTTGVGFASLALTPIPPVRVFGIFVAFGIFWAWILTITFVPAYTMFIPEESLTDFGVDETKGEGVLSRLISRLGQFTYRKAKIITVLTVIILLISAYGITTIVINDNPIRWFEADHPIRQADRVLNKHFGGTYMSYLVWNTEEDRAALKKARSNLNQELNKIKKRYPNLATGEFSAVEKLVENKATAYLEANNFDRLALLNEIQTEIDRRRSSANGDLRWFLEDISYVLGDLKSEYQVFKRPEVLRYMSRLQGQLEENEDVGKTSALPDIVKKVYKELRQGKEKYYKIPNSSSAVAQTLVSFQNSHNPNDLWHFAAPNYKRANVWIQLKNGDNRNMKEVKDSVEEWIDKNPPPAELSHNWAGLTYVNVVWQNKMVGGMMKSLLGSFLIVLVMMTFLFRSFWWGLLSMIPLSVTVTFSYGMIGFVGKSYDMPVAVLSSLTLGLSIDFAIHFIQRSRAIYQEKGSWEETIPQLFAGPSRAITRNALVVAIGFLPLLFAPLVPYKTVGVLISTILAISALGTLIILPAMITLLKEKVFVAVEEEKEESKIWILEWIFD
mgnify:CR=1 FL=1